MPEIREPHIREPLLKPVAIKKLRPTQITLGMREVRERRKQWRREVSKKKWAAFLEQHLIPAILGPGDAHYILDHHHLARALQEEGVEHLYVTITDDLSGLDPESFWYVLDQRNWIHPFDQNGKRVSYRRIPKTVDRMLDDPYRSLAGELRRAGGFAKDAAPFSEFLWADFLRRRIKLKIARDEFRHALKLALKMAKTKEADYLPGWSGPVEN